MQNIEIRLCRDNEIEQARSVLDAAYGQYEGSFPPENWTRYRADILDLDGRARHRSFSSRHGTDAWSPA